MTGEQCGGRALRVCPLSLTAQGNAPDGPEPGRAGLAGLSKGTREGQRKAASTGPWAGVEGPGTGQGGQRAGVVRGFGQPLLTGAR